MTDRQIPKLALAMRGASIRSVFYIGFLEVLQERKVHIDSIVTMSSGAIVAGAFACGNMDELKKQALKLNTEYLFSLIERSKTNSGIYNMDKIENVFRTLTANKHFEEVTPRLSFVTVDINAGEEVVLNMGDIAKSIKASCTLPGIFEPVSWGNKALVDGGIVNVIPGKIAKQAGADLVVGIDLRTKNHIFGNFQLFLRKLIGVFNRLLLLNQAEKLGDWVENKLRDMEIFDYYESSNQTQKFSSSTLAVVSRCMELAEQAEKKPADPMYGCDIMIRPTIPKPAFWKRVFKLRMLDFSNNEALYKLGRETAEKYLPKILSELASIEERDQQNLEKLNELIKHNES